MDMEYKTETQEETIIYPFSVAVRFRDAAKPYSFGTFNPEIKKGDWVVVETQKGVEMGEVEADAMNIEKYGLRMPTKGVIRIATEADHRTYRINADYETEAFRVCSEEIELLGLDMNLLNAQYTLDRSKVLFIYLAEQRVDFRELLKHLGSRLHCRIELRQIGERDKAKMVGAVGMCGMECCCRRFKTKFDVISINMAKNQLLALNTEKLSGMCGKLMCCLKYEDNDYKELTEGLPKMGSQVEYEGSVYRITNMNVMSEEAKLENHENVVFISLKDLREKAIPRKGVVMQRKADGEEKKVVRRVNRQDADATPHVSMELPSVQVDMPKERNPRPNAGNSGNTRRDRQNENTARTSGNNRRDRRHPEPRQSEKPASQTKNITVRTFGRKKKQENEA